MKVIIQDLQYVDEAIKLAEEVFDIYGQTVFNNKKVWLRRIEQDGFFVVICDDEGKVVGFTICDKHQMDLKVWICGVLPNARGKGVWSDMWNAVKEFAKNKGYDYVLLNTFPERFASMSKFLQKEHAEVYKKEQTDTGEKVFTKLYI